MSKLVEKMAQALAAADDAGDVEAIWAMKEEAHSGDCTKECHACIQCTIEHYESLARAALAVVMAEMREPSEAVVDAGHDVESHLWRGEIAGIWSAMLAQLEKEQAGG